MLARTLLFLVILGSFTQTKEKVTDFSGNWQFDEARSTYNLTTTVIKDLPEALKAKIPDQDVPRLAGVPRYFSQPPVLTIKSSGNRLTISAPQWFNGWIPYNKVFLIDGKEKEEKVGPGALRSQTRWEEGRVVREWSDKDTSIYGSSEGRDVFSLSGDGKTLTVESRNTHKFRTDVDGRPYELDDVQTIRSVFVRIR